MPRRRVAVAMSGGVDSSVAAALLVEGGEQVLGVMMRLWSPNRDRANRCCSPDDMARARQIAAQLGIPFYVVDAQRPFKNRVVDPFAAAYASGLTPNPCIECNRHVRWTFLLQYAETLGATHLATGHYARLHFESGRYHLLRSVDRHKDQSYVLSMLSQEQLARALFPLGELTKREVRRLAHEFGLEVADRPDSQDLCFAINGDYRSLLKELGVPLPPPGEIVDPTGRVLGHHQGLAFYTIGQRKGLGIAARHPLYVLVKDVEQNRLVVGPRHALARHRFDIAHTNWILGGPPREGEPVTVRVRYRASEVPCRVRRLAADRARIELSDPLYDVTPGQAAVFYAGEECLGMGIITS